MTKRVLVCLILSLGAGIFFTAPAYAQTCTGYFFYPGDPNPHPCAELDQQQQRLRQAQLQAQRAAAAAAAAERERQRQAQLQAAHERQLEAERAAEEAARQARLAQEAFERERDRYATMLRGLGTPASEHLRDSYQDDNRLRMGDSSDSTLRMTVTPAFSNKGSRTIDTGISTSRPAQVDRKNFNNASAHLQCAASIASKVEAIAEKGIGGDPSGVEFYAQQALDALNGSTHGVPCRYGPPMHVTKTQFVEIAASEKQLATALSTIAQVSQNQAAETRDLHQLQQHEEAIAPKAAPRPAPTEGLRDPSSDDARIQAAYKQQQTFHRQYQQRVNHVYAQQKANEQKLEQALQLLLKAQKATAQAMQDSH